VDIWSICGNLLHIQRILSIPPAADRHTAHVRERMRARVEGWSADDCWLGFLAGTACVQDMLCAVDCLALVSPRIFSTLIARSNSSFRGLCFVANEKSDLRPCIKWMVRCSSLCLWNLAQCLLAISSTSGAFSSNRAQWCFQPIHRRTQYLTCSVGYITYWKCEINARF